MSFAGLLGQRCTFQKRLGVDDRLGQPHDAWTDWRTDVPCRVTRPSGREKTTVVGRDVVEVSHVLYMAYDADITEAVKVREVTGPDGEWVIGEADVVLVRRASGLLGQAHHLEVLLRAVR